jgi:hypothetical protein
MPMWSKPRARPCRTGRSYRSWRNFSGCSVKKATVVNRAHCAYVARIRFSAWYQSDEKTNQTDQLFPSFAAFSLSELVTTETLLLAMAMPEKTGLSTMPKNG